jgi:threonine dehydrogenase-like Zn-dependent dehydrogenase
MSGRVLEIGSEVTTVKVGQLVATQQPHRQYFVSAPEELIAVPDGVTAEDAAWVPIALTAQIGARRAALVLGESAAVVGLGMVGQMVVQYLRLMGARHLIGIDPATQRIALAERSGITHGLPVDVRKATAFAADITEERMLDVVFDATGRTDVLGPAILLVRKQGRVVLVGDTATPTQQCLGPGFLSGSVSIIGAHLSARPDQASIYAPWSYLEMTRLFFHYVQQGRMSTAHLNTPGVSVSTAPALYDSIVTDRSTTMGVFFDWAR